MRKLKFIFLATMLIVNSIFGIIPGVMADGKNESEYENEIVLTNDHIKGFMFKVNEKEYTEGGIIEGVSNEDKFELKIDLADPLEFDKLNYGPETELKYPLPEGFSDHFTYEENLGSLSGYGDVKIEGDFVVITLNENILIGNVPSDIKEGTFEIKGKFSDDNDDWGKEIAMPGGEIFTVNFVPKSNTGVTIKKENGKPNKGGTKSDEIEWKVTVNTNLANTSDNPVFKDTLSANGFSGEDTGHTYKKDSVKIHEIVVKPSGVTSERNEVNISPTYNDDDNPTEMTINLEEGKAYEITYTTIPDNPGINEHVQYKNTADYDGNKDTSQTNPVFFGKAIEKSASSVDPKTQQTEWTITYNGNEQLIESGTVMSDEWETEIKDSNSTQTAEQKLVDGADGVTVEGLDSSKYTVNYTDGEQGFNIVFNEEFNEKITIKYTTEPVEDLKGSENFTVKNEAIHGQIDTSASKEVKYNTTDLTLSKSVVSGLDYNTKTMKWKITANQAGYDMAAGTTFVDTFTNKNMVLDKDAEFKVTIGGQPATEGDQGDYILTDKGTDGFEVKLNAATDKTVVVEYTTSFDQIKSVDEDRSKDYHNHVALTGSGLPGSPTDAANINSNPQQKANGSKNGSYNYQSKEFTWTIIFNYNSNTLENAILKDVLPEEHKITSATLEKGYIKSDGKFEIDETLTADIIGSNSFELDLGKIEEPHKLVYTTKMKDDVLPVDGESNYSVKNKAELFDGDTPDPNASWDKKVTVKHSAKVLDKKNGKQINKSDLIEWDFLYNTAQSKLKNVKITDTFQDDPDLEAPNQILNEESLEVYKVTYNSTGSMTKKGEKLTAGTDYQVSFNEDNATFILEFEELTHGIYVEYESVFIGIKDSPIANELSVTYNDGDSKEGSSDVPNLGFHYGAFASTSAGEFVIIKTDEATGEPMEGVEFTLERGNRKIISGTTDKDGVLDFGMPFATGTYKLTEKSVADYEPLDNYEFKLKADGGPYEGKQVVNVTNTPTKYKDKMCPDFTVTVKDAAGKLVKNQNVKLKNNTTGVVIETKTDENGKVVKVRSDLPAGDYKVYVIEQDKDIYINQITVEYLTDENKEECSAVAQPENKCEFFTVKVTENGTAKPNLNLKLKNKKNEFVQDNGNEIFVTDNDGQAKIPSENLPAGKYKLYNGDVYLDEITVSYLDGTCSASTVELTDLTPTCEYCTIQLLERNDTPRSGVAFYMTYKDSNGDEKTLKSKGTENTDYKKIELKDSKNDPLSAIHYFTTNGDGKVTFNEGEIVAGVTYTVHEIQLDSNGDPIISKDKDDNEFLQSKVLGNFKIEDECEVKLKPQSTGGGGGGGTPGEDEDGEDEEKPSTPEKVELPPKVEEIIKDSPEPDKVKLQPIKDNRKDGEKIPVNEDGTIDLDSLTPGTYDFVVVYDGEKEDGSEDLVVGKMKITVDDDGNVTVEEELIDPYGKITDKETGEIVGGVHLEIIFADTKRNRQKGRTPGELVNLPELPNFPPNKNHNPQTSVDELVWNDEVSDFGNYAWLVHPETDYQIVAKKPGYKDYISPVISVEYDIIKHDFVMEEDDEKKKDDEKEKEPDKPKEPGKQDDGDKQDEEKGVGQGTDSKTKGDALTQTGESRNLLLTFGGILSMLFGFSLLLYCRKQEAKS